MICVRNENKCCLLSIFWRKVFRYFLKELSDCESIEEYVRLHAQQETTGAFQPLFPCEQKFDRSNLGTFFSLVHCWSVCSSKHSLFELLQRHTTSSMLRQLEYPSYAMHSKSGIYTSRRISLRQLQVERHLLGLLVCALLQDQVVRLLGTCQFVKWDEHPIRMQADKHLFFL